MAGSLDKGDLIGIPFTVCEAKSVKTITLAAFMDELTQEKINANEPYGFVAIKRVRKSVGQGYAVLTIDSMIDLLLSVPSIQERLIK